MQSSRVAACCGALVALAACSVEAAQPPLLPPAPPPSLQQLATTAGLLGATLREEACAGGLAGVRLEARASFGATHAFAAALDRLPEPRHLAGGALTREADGRLLVSLHACPGRAIGPAWLDRLAESTPERLRLDALEWGASGATIEGVADERGSIDAFAAALRADPGLASVEVPAVGADGPLGARLAFVLVATRR